ncbi:hypothetical protein Baya_10771 [Bagarius yarrelli]|uniref:Uncharacterized protein n=1 Tax=Bagarius yarrelli TaxID=175774 RepID=A0A556UZB2_BAGYA|nr:hypothetical protein Baya_10771 [Bagarius yarrelli]
MPTLALRFDEMGKQDGFLQDRCLSGNDQKVNSDGWYTCKNTYKLLIMSLLCLKGVLNPDEFAIFAVTQSSEEMLQRFLREPQSYGSCKPKLNQTVVHWDACFPSVSHNKDAQAVMGKDSWWPNRAE